MKDTYTAEEVVDLILQERNRCRDICDSHSEWFQRRIREFHSSLERMYKEGDDACRRIRNNISESSALDFGEPVSDEDKIKKLYKL
jgi:hypothetical protein